MAFFLILLFLVSAMVAGLWTAAWSYRRLGPAATGPIIAGVAEGCCLTVGTALCLLVLPRPEDRGQPELSAVEAAAVARSEAILQCRRRGGDLQWCDGYAPALADRACDHAWGVILLSEDGRAVRRVAITSRGNYDGLTGG